MSNGYEGATSTMTPQLQDGDDLGGGMAQSGAPQASGAVKTNGASASGQLMVDEVIGKVILEPTLGGETTQESIEMHTEVVADGAESGEEYAEATAEQLAAPADGESAFSDLQGIEGFEEYAGGESTEATEAFLPEAGEESAEGGQEFFPLIASLASTVLPMLVSKAGPALARGVMQRLSARAKVGLQRQRKAGGSGILSVLGRLFESAEASTESGTEAVDEAWATTFRSVSGWVQGKKAESDYGCIVLPPGAFGGQQLGSFGFGVFSSAVLLAQRAVVAGYPGNKPFAELWGIGRKIKTVTANQLIYGIDTVGGQSGAPVYIKYQGKRYVVGIHNYGAASGNSATRITAPVFANLQKWSKL